MLAAASGLVTYLAYPDVNLWWAAPFGLAGLMVATHRASLRLGAALGLIFGLALHLPLISWSGIFLGWVPRGALTVLMGVYLSVAGLGFAGISASRRPGARALALAGWWVATEGLLSRYPWGGFGWTRVAFSQSDAPTLALASWGGAPLVSFAVALAGSLLAWSVLLVLGGGRVRTVVALNLGAVLVMACGAVVPRPVTAQAGELNILGVQGNTPARLDFNRQRRQVLDNHARVAQEAAAQIRAGTRPRPDLMVWPENASDIDPLRNSDAAGVINRAVDAVGAPALIGGLRVLDAPAVDAPEPIENTSWLWVPRSGIAGSYVKQLPVPFVEYVPWRRFFQTLVPMLGMAGNMVPGQRLGTFEVAGTRVGDLICFEIVSDGLVRRTVDAGARVVVLQTNNATFGHTAESTQQLAITRLRAVEHGRSFLQISTVGVSAFVAPDGTVSARTELYTPRAIQETVPLRITRTVSDRLGAAPEMLLAAGGMLGFVLGVRRSRIGGRVLST